MILPPSIAEKAILLANTPEELLPGFSPLERATIIALKAMMKNEKEAASAGTPAASEHRAGHSYAEIQLQRI